MNRYNKKILITCLIPSFLAAAIAVTFMLPFIKNCYPLLKKPDLSPFGFLIPIIFLILYLLMGIATYYASVSYAFPNDLRTALVIYSIQLFLNVIWTILFFRLKFYGIAFFVLCLSWFFIFLNVIVYARFSKQAGALMIPFLIWIGYMLYTNAGIALLC